MISISVRALPLLLALLASETNAQPRVQYSGNCVNQASNCSTNPTAAVISTHFNGSFQVSSQADLNNYVNSMVATVNTQVNTVVQKVVNYNTQDYNHGTRAQAEASAQGVEVKTEWDKLGVMVQEGGVISRMIQNSTTGFNSYVAGQAAVAAVAGTSASLNFPTGTNVVFSPTRTAPLQYVACPEGGACSSERLNTTYTIGSLDPVTNLPRTITARYAAGTRWRECTYTADAAPTIQVSGTTASLSGSYSIGTITTTASANPPSATSGADTCTGSAFFGRLSAFNAMANAVANPRTTTNSAGVVTTHYTGTVWGSTATLGTTVTTTVTPGTPGTPARAAIAEVRGNAFVQCGASIIGGTCTND